MELPAAQRARWAKIKWQKVVSISSCTGHEQCPQPPVRGLSHSEISLGKVAEGTKDGPRLPIKLCGRWREIAISNNVGGVNHFPSILQHGYSGNLFRPVQQLSDYSDGVKCSRNQGMWGGDRLRAEVGGVGPRHVRSKCLTGISVLAPNRFRFQSLVRILFGYVPCVWLRTERYRHGSRGRSSQEAWSREIPASGIEKRHAQRAF